MNRPAPGRIVWYWPRSREDDPLPRLAQQPWPAIVCGAYEDGTCNLICWDAECAQHIRKGVALIAQGDAKAAGESYCELPPHQFSGGELSEAQARGKRQTAS
jgi:hypothetical protein